MPIVRKKNFTWYESSRKIFLKIWGQKKHTKSFLENNLSRPVITKLNLDTLTKVENTFLNIKNPKNYSHVLYEVDIRDTGKCYVFILFEHENCKSGTAPLQVLSCMIDIWMKDNDKNIKNNTSKTLKPIIPIVLHYGYNVLRWKSNFSFFFEQPTELDCYVPKFKFKLCDLASIFVENL